MTAASTPSIRSSKRLAASRSVVPSAAPPTNPPFASAPQSHGPFDPRPHLPANWRGGEDPAQVVRRLLTCFHEMASTSEQLFASPGETFISAEGAFHQPRFIFFGARAAPGALRLVLFAGWNGRDLDGTITLFNLLHRLVENPAIATGYNLLVYPLVNVTGFLRGTAGTALGHDLENISWTAGLPPPELRAISADFPRHAAHGWVTIGTRPTEGRTRVTARTDRNDSSPSAGLAGLAKTAFGLAIDSGSDLPSAQRVSALTDLIETTLARYRSAISYGGEL